MTTTARPLILDLLPATHGARITAVSYFDGTRPAYTEGAWFGSDGAWHTNTTTIDPGQIIEFTVHNSPDTTTYTEGADTNEWTAIIRREQP